MSFILVLPVLLASLLAPISAVPGDFSVSATADTEYYNNIQLNLTCPDGQVIIVDSPRNNYTFYKGLNSLYQVQNPNVGYWFEVITPTTLLQTCKGSLLIDFFHELTFTYDTIVQIDATYYYDSNNPSAPTTTPPPVQPLALLSIYNPGGNSVYMLSAFSSAMTCVDPNQQVYVAKISGTQPVYFNPGLTQLIATSETVSQFVIEFTASTANQYECSYLYPVPNAPGYALTFNLTATTGFTQLYFNTAY